MLFAQLQVGKDGAIPANIGAHQVIEKLFTLTHQPQQALLGGIVFFVTFQMAGQFVDPVGKQGNLRFG